MQKYQIYPKALLYPFLMIAVMWTGYYFQVQGYLGNCAGAIIPLVPAGLKGIIFSPFLHGDIGHLLSNSIPIAVLMFLLYQFYSFIANRIFIFGWLFTGLLVWLLPPIDIFTGEYMYTCTIGASGVVYVLAFFLFFSGVFQWNMKLLTVSLLVAMYYGSLIWGVFPEELFSTLNEPSNISWQSHLSGAVVGTVLAFYFKNKGEKKRKFIWEFPNYYNEKDDELWMQYRENHPEDFEDSSPRKRDEVWERLEELRKKDE